MHAQRQLLVAATRFAGKLRSESPLGRLVCLVVGHRRRLQRRQVEHADDGHLLFRHGREHEQLAAAELNVARVARVGEDANAVRDAVGGNDSIRSGIARRGAEVGARGDGLRIAAQDIEEGQRIALHDDEPPFVAQPRIDDSLLAESVEAAANDFAAIAGIDHDDARARLVRAGDHDAIIDRTKEGWRAVRNVRAPAYLAGRAVNADEPSA